MSLHPEIHRFKFRITCFSFSSQNPNLKQFVLEIFHHPKFITNNNIGKITRAHYLFYNNMTFALKISQTSHSHAQKH